MEEPEAVAQLMEQVCVFWDRKLREKGLEANGKIMLLCTEVFIETVVVPDLHSRPLLVLQTAHFGTRFRGAWVGRPRRVR